MSEHNFSVTVPMFTEYANGILRQKINKQEAADEQTIKVGKNWVGEHFQRWKDTYETVRSKRLHHARAQANIDHHFYNDYFEKLRTVLTEYNIQGRDIYNLDEKGFRLGEAALCTVIVKKGDPEQAELAEDGSKEMVTVLECISTDDWVAKPSIIYKGKGYNYGWSVKDGYLYGYSESGWIDTHLYSAWIKTVFDPTTSTRFVSSRLPYICISY
jgi:regulator of RNase E activity RraB